MEDSDAATSAVGKPFDGKPNIGMTTGTANYLDHTFDFGFVCVPPLITSIGKDTATCTNGVANTNAAVFVRGIIGMAKYAYRSNATDSLWALTATASTDDSIRISNIANPSLSTTYTFRIWATDTTCYNDTTVVLSPTVCPQPCVFSNMTAVAGSCSPATNKYDVTGQLTFTNPPSIGVLLIKVTGKGYQKLEAPFTSPLNYTIANLNSDGLVDTVEAIFSSGNCSSFAIFTAPTMCIPSVCVSPETGGTEAHTFTIPMTRTNWTLPVTLPKFDDRSGTRVLKNVLLTVNQTIRNWGVIESTDNAETIVNIITNGTTTLKLGSDTLARNTFTAANNAATVQAGILVPAQGAWGGDVGGSTLFAMSSSVSTDLNNLVNPTLSSSWVTNVTGNPTHDDDMIYFAPVYSENSNCWLYSTPVDLTKFIGTGNLGLTANAKGAGYVDGSGNTNASIRTAASTDVSILYIYCNVPICTPPTIASTAVDTATCTNGVANTDAKVAIRGIVGMAKYAYRSNTTDSLWAINATASTLDSIRISSLANPSVSTTYTFRIWGTDTTCYNDTTVILNQAICPPCSITATFTQNACNNNGSITTAADDYFTITVSAVSSTNGGTSGKYEVMFGGTVLNLGGTNYGSPVTVGASAQFNSDGATTYSLTVRDMDIPACTTTVFTTLASASCSTIPCKPVICLPVTVTKF